MNPPEHLNAQLKLSAAQLTDAGAKDVNEDCMGIAIPDGNALIMKGAVAVIADGVSTAEAGKEASETCVQNFLSDYYSTPDSWSVATAGQKILTALNRWLYGQGQHYIEAHKGYISTLSALVLKSNTAYIFHIGDSRIYRLREGDLEQLTNDHCARITGQNAYLTRAMGMDVRLEVDFRRLEVQQGDLFFLSTDGIHDFIKRRDLTHCLRDVASHKISQEQACQQLIDAAKNNASTDNLTCQFVSVEELPQKGLDEACESLSQLPFPPDLAPGQKLGGYEVEALIHASSRSQLYEVSDVVTGELYAMKTPSANYEDDPAYIERFVMEPWIGQRMDSPHVVKVTEPKQAPQFLYYLTEYVEGQTLAQWIEGNPKPDVNRVIQITEQIVKGLRAFHRKEVLHQDLKPDNIVIDKQCQVKLIDFGSSYVMGVHEISSPILRDEILGTADYSAPELLLNEKSGFKADQFSLASIVYEMLTGRLPYGQGFEGIRQRSDLNKLQYQPSYHHNVHVPVWLDGALRKALNFNSKQRYEALSEFVFDLNHPNSQFLSKQHIPLIKKNPLRFWQSLSAVLFISQLMILLLWLNA